MAEPGRPILITGVAGFIGSNLAAEALARGYRVVGVDDLSQGDELNMAAFRGHQAFAFHRFDVRDRSALEKVAGGCGTIAHLAAFKIPRYSDALDTLLVNAHGAESVADVAARVRARVVAASTSDVYGKNPAVPFAEDAAMVIGSPEVRRWAYAISKMFDEQLLFAYHERHGIDVVLMRFFGGYGPHQNLTWWGGPQSVFINAALDDKECEVHGDGQQTRSFTHVSDHVDGIMRCIEMDAARNQVFNLGQTEEITIAGLAELVWRLVRGPSSTPRVKLIPYQTFGKYEDVQRRLPNIEKARRVLGFEPKVGLEEGLRGTIRWQVERRRAQGVATPDPFPG